MSAGKAYGGMTKAHKRRGDYERRRLGARDFYGDWDNSNSLIRHVIDLVWYKEKPPLSPMA